MKINNAFQLTNPTLRYKLDPGEPGMATPTPASRSIAKVATHEATNIRRFKKEALEDGGVVVYSYIYLNLQFQGSFLAAVSGKSKALVIVPAEESKTNENIKVPALKDSKENEKVPEKVKHDSEDIKNAIAEITNGETAKIDGTIRKLENDKLLLRGQLSNIENTTKDDEMKSTYNENRIKEIESKIEYLEQKKELEKQKEYFKSILASYNMANKLVGLIYNSSTVNESGNLLDDVA